MLLENNLKKYKELPEAIKQIVGLVGLTATIIFNWTPNFTDGAGFTFIDFPPYTDGCRPVDGGDGKCGSPDGYLKKAVNENWPKTHPQAAAMFKKLSFTTGQIGAMAAYVDIDKMTHQDAAKEWLKKNKKVWKKFTK